MATQSAERPAVWDIVRVDLPYADEATTRRRPALVVAVPDGHDDFAILWVLMITSARHAPWPFDVTISDLGGTGLSHASIVRTAKIAVLDTGLTVRIDELPARDRTRVRENLSQVLCFVLQA